MSALTIGAYVLLAAWTVLIVVAVIEVAVNRRKRGAR